MTLGSASPSQTGHGQDFGHWLEQQNYPSLIKGQERSLGGQVASENPRLCLQGGVNVLSPQPHRFHGCRTLRALSTLHGHRGLSLCSSLCKTH